MSTYAFSDVHGHRVPLERLLERVSPSADDAVFMLGDMIDRGPDPVGVLRACRDLSGATVLMGNHEDLMLTYFEDPDDPVNLMNWEMNGGATTSAGLAGLGEGERMELLDWVASLPTYAYALTEGRPFVMAHAGIRSGGLLPRAEWTEDKLEALMASQSTEDLLWIREDFWEKPTGLVDANGNGPIVIAGHTPTPYLEGMADRPDRPARDEDGLCRMVRVGACERTGGVADRWDIDCGAAGGAGFGRLLMLRLDDGEEFYEGIGEGE
uniref:metallophosphoesterase family protein n=1 Tax=Olsenella uli TaxID=133926 RepID=UPI0028E5C4D9|nr:metallophosphoesterase family protein [Olsenella uli]